MASYQILCQKWANIRSGHGYFQIVWHEGRLHQSIGGARIVSVTQCKSLQENAREEIMRTRNVMRALGTAAFMDQLAVAQAAPFMIVGNDEKLLWDDNGKPVLSPPGKDSVLIVDLANPLDPKIVVNLPLKNSVVGPPVNAASTRRARSR